MDFVHILIYWLTNNKFVTFSNFDFFLILYYFPQHCLYFFPEPHENSLNVFSVLLIHIVLYVFFLFHGHLVHYIISIIYIINITNFMFYVDKMWTIIINITTICFLFYYNMFVENLLKHLI
jgi:hypothetical protein